VLVLLEPLYRERVRSFLWFGVVVVAVALFAVIFDALPVYSGHSPASIVLGSFLAMSVYGLVLVEQLYRGLPIGSRWGLKPLCLALAAGYIFELYFFADGFLFVRADPDVWAVRGRRLGSARDRFCHSDSADRNLCGSQPVVDPEDCRFARSDIPLDRAGNIRALSSVDRSRRLLRQICGGLVGSGFAADLVVWRPVVVWRVVFFWYPAGKTPGVPEQTPLSVSL